MKVVSPKRLAANVAAAADIRDNLTNSADQLDVDVEEYLYVLEQDTDLISILDRYEEMVSMKKDYLQRARARATQLEKQAEAGRRAMQAILEALQVRKLERPTYTASLQAAPRTLVLDDWNSIPFEFLVPTPDKQEITRALKDGDEVPGARLSDPRETLYIRRGKQPAEETSDGK